MPIRDIIVTAIVAGLLPVALFNPFVGISLWTWLSVMNPHRMTWGFAYDLPLAQLVAIATLASVLFAGKNVRFPVTPITLMLIAFLAWVGITTVFAIHFDASTEMWLRTSKMLLMTLVAFAIVREERQVRIFLWVLVLSVAFFGIKGGVFTIVTGGQHLVFGPPASHIADNNAISVALVMMIPMVALLYQQATNTYVKIGMAAAIVLSAISVLGSYSRTAFVAAAAMLVFLLVKARHFVLLALMTLSVPVMLAAMPQKWWDRMTTIHTGLTQGEWDLSVQGRFNAWAMAWNLATDRPLLGGGFAIYEPDVFARYAPNPTDLHSAHSIYFQILGEHGFVGLAMFLVIAFLAWRAANRIIKRSTGDDVHWRASVARAVQVSMVGFLVGGLALNIGYWDVYYFEIVILVALERIVAGEKRGRVVLHPSASPVATGVRTPDARTFRLTNGGIQRRG